MFYDWCYLVGLFPMVIHCLIVQQKIFQGSPDQWTNHPNSLITTIISELTGQDAQPYFKIC
jgi:hypothetical protein